ncbi:L-fuconolactonase [Chromohalobacter canadensis]|uniref:L-fuconolactonase n=1 Tax=Chromohalobacter canadensis TaxID=141389 RepID=A0A285VTN7_9GAMM|nr:amidohydrolase family protein [Chromohalobacter canadensis]SOC57419.1 L-fuconolactonase [Chromohalobacter canadensis]
MRIDAHQHFWRFAACDFPWVDDTMACLQQDYLPSDLAEERRACGIDASIAVQARPLPGDTEFLLNLAHRDNTIVGVVGWVDPLGNALEEQLAQWASPKLCGFRHLIQDEDDPGDYLRDPEVHRGIAMLQRHGYRYDVLVTARHLAATSAFCRACDEQTLILDHLGKPNVREEEFDSWRRDIAPLGELPHVACKLSGLVTEADWRHWTPQALWPYLDVALSVFGEDRLLFGSDWPVCRVAGEYRDVFSLVNDWADDRGVNKDALFGANAQRLYGLRSAHSSPQGTSA